MAKRDCHLKKMLLYIWWDCKGLTYYNLLPSGQTINSKRYCKQLEDWEKAVLRKRPELRRNVVFHMWFFMDKSRPRVALATNQKLKDSGLEVMQHPPYSPVIPPVQVTLKPFGFTAIQFNGPDQESIE